MSDRNNYANYDYSIAILLYKSDKKFSNFSDYIKNYMVENDFSPGEVRELCNLSIFNAVGEMFGIYEE